MTATDPSYTDAMVRIFSPDEDDKDELDPRGELTASIGPESGRLILEVAELNDDGDTEESITLSLRLTKGSKAALLAVISKAQVL